MVNYDLIYTWDLACGTSYDHAWVLGTFDGIELVHLDLELV